MQFVIKYIKAAEFVGAVPFDGSLDEAKVMAVSGFKSHRAELAAVMDGTNLDAAPKALVASPYWELD